MEPIRILYEDRHLIVCVKPVGVLSQPSPEEQSGDMLSLLREQCSLPYIGLIHRLDRGVGGVMVFAKTQAAAGKLSAFVADRSLTKEYLALVHGMPDPPDGEMVDLLYKDAAQNRSFVVDRKRAGVKDAKLLYRTLRTVTIDTEPLSLVQVHLVTGRTHQIRVQFSSRAMPLYGDGKYGARDHGPIGLWSYRLRFPHPFERGKTVDVCCPPHADHAAFAITPLTEQDASRAAQQFL
ncbi:MAG: RluA family pseudouridine synthase [Clostridia bacterium]|nr:RluA family pseudouridine synthase [Clostridia bacterium]